MRVYKDGVAVIALKLVYIFDCSPSDVQSFEVRASNLGHGSIRHSQGLS